MKKGFISQVLDYYFVPEHDFMFGSDIERAMADFFGDPHGYIDKEASGYFTDWFLSDFVLMNGKTPIKYFYDTNPLKLPIEELQMYETMIKNNRYDFFEVKSVRRGKGMTLKSVRDGEEFKIYEKSATNDTVLGDVFLCRIIKMGDRWEIASGGTLAMSKPSARDRQRMKHDFSVLDPKIVYREIVLPERRAVGDIKTEMIAGGGTLMTGMTGNVSQEEEDDCAVCQSTKAAKQKGRAPTMDELKEALKRSGGAFNKEDHPRREG